MAEEVCKLVLEKPVTKDECYDFKAIRRRVICRAWELIEKERIPFRDAIKRSWTETKKSCAEVHAIV